MTDFDTLFRSAGYVRRRELRQQWADSGLPLDAWVAKRRAENQALLALRAELRATYGAHNYRIHAPEVVSVRRNGSWGPL